MAADTVLALMIAGLFNGGRSQRAVGAAGIMAGDLVAARERRRARGFIPPRRDPLDFAGPEPERPAPRPADQAPDPAPERPSPRPRVDVGAPVRRAAWNKIPETDWRICRGPCGRRLAIENFLRRADVDSRRAWCDACRKEYQRQRYLSVEAGRRLGVLLRFVVGEDDACVDDACPRCHQPIAVGEQVEADDVLVQHERCPKARV